MTDLQRRVDALGQFRVADVASPVLTKDDHHHLFKVLRARVGEEVVVTNGAGRVAMARVDESVITRISDGVTDPQPATTTVYLAPLRGDRGEWAIAKLTELGVSTVVPLVCERLAVKFTGDARDKLLGRWRKIAAEASGQCRRSYDLRVADPVSVADVPLSVAVAMPGESGTLTGVSAIAIGPEGGWSSSEWPDDQPRIGFGETVLRTETAALVAGTLLKFGGVQWPRLSSE